MTARTGEVWMERTAVIIGRKGAGEGFRGRLFVCALLERLMVQPLLFCLCRMAIFSYVASSSGRRYCVAKGLRDDVRAYFQTYRAVLPASRFEEGGL